MSAKTYDVDIADYLETKEDITEYLQQVLSTGTEEDFIYALSIASRAYGMAEIAETTGLSRTSLYKSLKEGGNPSFKTVSKVAKALGLRLAMA